MATLLLCAVLSACGASVQAPVNERSERLVNTPPIIVDSSRAAVSVSPSSNQPRVASGSATTTGSAPRTTSISRSPVNSPVGNNTVASISDYYTVKSGDTLYSIAFQFDLDARDLAVANSLNPPYTIFIDQQLNLDTSRIARSASRGTDTSNIGTAVTNNSVIQSQTGGGSTGGVTRAPINRSNIVREPQWRWPHRGRVLRAFGTGTNRGLDIAGSVGEPVFAAADGEVVYSGIGVQGSGALIIIRHGETFLSAYSHNSAMLVNLGDVVSGGSKIAEIGEGPSGEAMLHFEIRVDGETVDPIRFLPGR